jgi:hypothetical protein
MPIEIQDTSEIIEVEVFKLPEKEVELKVEEPIITTPKKIEVSDPLDLIAEKILNTVNLVDES